MFRAQNLKDDIPDLIQIKKYPGVILGLSFVALVKLHEKFGCHSSVELLPVLTQNAYFFDPVQVRDI